MLSASLPDTRGLDLDEEQRHWNGLPVFDQEGTFDEMHASLPSFERSSFQMSGSDTPNPFYNVVSRKAEKDKPAIPVGLVSPTYCLIDHRDVFTTLRRVIHSQGIDVGDLKCNATFTTHQERMELRVNFPDKYKAHVGDGNPIGLQLFCVNSVDGRSSFVLYLGWFRFVCSNGLIVGTTTAKWKKAHRDSLRLDSINAVLTKGVAKAEKERERLKRSVEEKVPDGALTQWADEAVAKAWGVKAATRILHIVNEGRDCELLNPFEKAPPSQRAVTLTHDIPGALPAPATRFSVMQAASFIASHRNAVQERAVMTRQIPALLAKLRRS